MVDFSSRKRRSKKPSRTWLFVAALAVIGLVVSAFFDGTSAPLRPVSDDRAPLVGR